MLYELHISVHKLTPKQQMRWIVYCEQQGYKCIRVVNDAGEHPEQFMIAKWIDRESREKAEETCESIAKDIAANGFTVCRSKVEGMLNNKSFDNINITHQPGWYWEFHMKIKIKTLDDLDKLFTWKDEQKQDYLGLSLSTYGRTKLPIVTIRLHEGTRYEAMDIKNATVKSLKKHGFHIDGKLQAECAIYDTFEQEDKGWIKTK